jgi:hypothetical protein
MPSSDAVLELRDSAWFWALCRNYLFWPQMVLQTSKRWSRRELLQHLENAPTVGVLMNECLAPGGGPSFQILEKQSLAFSQRFDGS